MYISPDNLTIHSKMTEVWSKRRVLLFVFIVKNRNELDFTLKKAKQWSRQHARYSLTQISTTMNVFSYTYHLSVEYVIQQLLYELNL